MFMGARVVEREGARGGGVPMGFRFCPSEQEIVVQFLYPRIKGLLGNCREVVECDVYGDGDGDGEEWRKRLEQDQDPNAVMYFFTKLKKKGTEKGKRWDRVTKSGTWRTQRDDKIYWGRNRHVGSKRSFKFTPKNKQDPRMRGWIMHEFRVDGQLLQHIKGCENKDYVVCRIKKDRETKKMMKDSSSSSSSCNINHEHDHAAAVAVDGPEKWVKLKQLEHMLLDEEVAADDQDGSGATTPTSVLQNVEFGEAPLACNYYGDDHEHYMQQQMDLLNPNYMVEQGQTNNYQEMMMKVQQLEQMLFNEEAADQWTEDGATPASVLQNMDFGQAPVACNYYGDQYYMQQQMDLMNPNYMEQQAAADEEQQLMFNNDNVYTQCLAKEADHGHQATTTTTTDHWCWSIDDDMAAGQQDYTMFSLEELTGQPWETVVADNTVSAMHY